MTISEPDGINLAWLEGVAHSKQARHLMEFTDRVRSRLRDPDYSMDHNRNYENRYGYCSDPSASRWSDSARISVFILGVFGLALSQQASGYLRKALGLFGLASLIRAATNLQVTDVIGWVANPTVRLIRTVRINAPIDDVYNFLSHFSNYPRFMSYVQNVEVNDQGGLHWTVRGPAGVRIHWNTAVGKMLQNQVISWRSWIDSPIRNSGEILLKDLLGEGTLVHIKLTYAPPVGALGYAVAHFLGYDPKEKIDEDLLVLKALIEKKYHQIKCD